MEPKSVQEYTEVMRVRYAAATKEQRTALLTEFCAVVGYHRKAAIRRLRRPPRVGGHRQGRPPTYSAAAVTALAGLWEASGRLGSKRLVAILPDLVAALERHGELHLQPALRTAVLAMRPATVDRRLRPYRRRPGGRRPYGQAPATAALQAAVPVRTFGEWADARPGECQVDLVLQCRERAAGAFLATLMVVDPASTWQDFDALLTKGYLHVRGGLRFAALLGEIAACHAALLKLVDHRGNAASVTPLLRQPPMLGNSNK